MVDPNVFDFVKNNGYDASKISGFAFGMGSLTGMKSSVAIGRTKIVSQDVLRLKLKKIKE
jgi:hypothetical protein